MNFAHRSTRNSAVDLSDRRPYCLFQRFDCAHARQRALLPLLDGGHRVSPPRRQVGHLLWIAVLFFVFSLLPHLACSDEAIDRIRRDRATGRVEAYLEEGKQQLERGAHVRAIRLLSEAIKRGARPEAYQLRGQAYLAIGSYPEAIEDFTRFVQSGAGGTEALILRGDAHVTRGDFPNALIDYNAAIARDPLHMDAYLGRAIAYLSREKYAAAMNDLRTVLQTDAHNVEALTNMGVACMSVDLPEAARSYFRKALTVESSPRWKERIEDWLKASPVSSAFEQKVGGLSGYLSRELKGQPPGVALEQGQTPRTSSPQISRESASTKTLPRTPSKNLVQLRNTLNMDAGDERQVSGKVTGSHMGFKWTLTFRAKGRRVLGTLRIIGPAGFDETHYCTGTYDRGLVDAGDRMGYRFQGRVTEDLRLVGTLTTNHGTSFGIDMDLEE